MESSYRKDGNNALSLSSATDYYPYGMPMPNRTLSGAEGYRYAFQGQERDPETGKEAFELRLWDGRIGRWLTTDPKKAGVSPYWGMNNNPVSVVDPDGGKGDNWYRPLGGSNDDIVWFDGSKNIEGFENLGYYYKFFDVFNNENFYNGDDLGHYYNGKLVEFMKTGLIFKAGETYNISINKTSFLDAPAISFGNLTISYGNENDITTGNGFSLGASAGPFEAGINTLYSGNEVTFYKDVYAKSLLDVFTKTDLINESGGGAILHHMNMMGFSNRYTMEKLWSASLSGIGLKIGVEGSRYVPSFHEKTYNNRASNFVPGNW